MADIAKEPRRAREHAQLRNIAETMAVGKSLSAASFGGGQPLETDDDRGAPSPTLSIAERRRIVAEMI